MYNYILPQDEVLPKCEDVLSKLGYEIDIYSPTDYHLVTKEKIVKTLFRRAHYILHLKVEDRITIYVYTETRTFKRASELGLLAGDLTELEASNNLNLHFQSEIFDPITSEFEKRGFTFWDKEEQNVADDLEIRKVEQKRIRQRSLLQNQKKKREQSARQKNIKQYNDERDLARIEAVRESEHFVNFIRDSSAFSHDWSLIRISKILVKNDFLLERALREVLQTYRDYSGEGKIVWIVDPEGKVFQVEIQIDTNPYTPEDELKHYMSSAFRRMIFPPAQPVSTYLALSRGFFFSGKYNNLKYAFDRPRILAVYDTYPPLQIETVKDTFFEY